MFGSKNDPVKPHKEDRASTKFDTPESQPAPASGFGGLRREEPRGGVSSSTTATIGPGTRITGTLVGAEDLLVQGRVDGTIDLKDHDLVVGPQGKLKANVLAKNVTVEGELEGDIYAREKISILSSSNVRGKLVADSVVLESGARFCGPIDMDVEAHLEEFRKMGADTDQSLPGKSNSDKSSTDKSSADKPTAEKSTSEPASGNLGKPLAEGLKR